MTNKTTGAELWIFILALVLTGDSFSADQAQSGGERAVEFSKLFSRSPLVRRNSQVELKTERERLAPELVAIIEKLSVNPEPRQYEGELHLAVELAGVWKVEEAVDVLVKLIDFELDRRSFPDGDKLPQSAFFPAASALADINGPIVAQAVLFMLESNDKPRRARLGVWVLYKCFGRKTAGLLLSKHAQRSKAEITRVRLEKSTELLSQGEQLIK